MGKRFGLGPNGGWTMTGVMDDIMEEHVGAEDKFGGGNQDGVSSEVHESWNGGTDEHGLGLNTHVSNVSEGRQSHQLIPDLNEEAMVEDDAMAILPYVALREPLLSSRQPLHLFGIEILTSNVKQGVFIEQGNPPQKRMSV